VASTLPPRGLVSGRDPQIAEHRGGLGGRLGGEHDGDPPAQLLEVEAAFGVGVVERGQQTFALLLAQAR
jgi:hypothetical protein